MQKKIKIITGILGAAILVSGGVAFANNNPNQTTKPVTNMQASIESQTAVDAEVSAEPSVSPSVSPSTEVPTTPVITPVKAAPTTPTMKAATQPTTPTPTPEPAKVTAAASTPTEATTPTPAKTIGKLVIYEADNTNHPGDYYGEIVNGKAEGQGEVHWKDTTDYHTTNRSYKGEFHNGYPMGKGTNTYTTKDGVVHSDYTEVQGIA